MYRVYSRYSKPAQPQTVEQGINAENSPKIADKPPDTTNPIDSDKAVKFPDFKPLIAGVPESAPAYVPLLKVTQVPVLQGCVYSKKKDDCKCYTKQATIYETSKKYCLAVVAGEYFNPYLVHVPLPVVASDKHKDKAKDEEQLKKVELVSADIDTTPSDDL